MDTFACVRPSPTRHGEKAMRKQLIGALGAASLAVSRAALAAPTLVGTTTNASGIDGVVVGSVTYDVTFSTSSFDSTFSTFVGAQDASFVLAGDLNALSVTGLSFRGASGFDCRPGDLTCAIWPGSSSVTASDLIATVGGGGAPWAGNTGIGGSLGCPQTLPVGPVCYEAAHWAAITTGAPEPATLSPLGLGIAGIGLARRKRKS
jgi:hypothetical protein